MSTTRRMVVVGGGTAGGAAVAELRHHGFDGAITLVCGENTEPYERPPLSKEFLLGVPTTDGALPPPGWYEQHDIDLRLGTLATEIDPRTGSVTLSDGSSVGYDRLLIATGVRPRVLPGMDGDQVLYLRTIDDAVRLREQIRAAGHVAVLGGGFIGCEVAAAAIRLGKQATILEALPSLLHRALPPDLGDVVADIHAAEGVDVRTGQHVTGIRHLAGSVTVLTTAGELECDLLVVGVGTVPDTRLAEQAGLAVSNGIEVDAYCATSVPGIYAAGDVAIQHLPGHAGPVRVEHHDSAIRQGRAAARHMLGLGEPFADVPWFWSDQYEHTIQSAGLCDTAASYVLRGSLTERSFSAFWLDGNRIRSVISLNRPRDVIEARRLIAAGHPVTAAHLSDDTIPLKRLARPQRAAADT
jgi:3-phenylpropionate/trans-cinnamate dioxygenase ferredoxin reductase subunit